MKISTFISTRQSLSLLLGSSLFIGNALAVPPEIIMKPGELVCCVGEHGRRICGDTPQPRCSERALKVYNRQGLLVRDVPPPMSEEQKATILAKEQEEKARKIAEREQRRKDQALLDTYASLADVDRMWQHNESERIKEISDILGRIGAARQRKQALEAEAKTHADKLLSPELDKFMRGEDTNIKVQNELLVIKRKEMEEKRQRYESDRKRYIELMGDG
jgi:hypothetical protein